MTAALYLFESPERRALRELVEALPVAHRFPTYLNALAALDGTRYSSAGIRVRHTPLERFPWVCEVKHPDDSRYTVTEHRTERAALASAERQWRAKGGKPGAYDRG